MPVRTQHQFLDLYPANRSDKRLILGTIHPPRVDEFSIQFFYGNRGSFWKRLAESFPMKDFSNLTQILEVLSRHNVWVSDIVKSCVHKNGKAADIDLIDIIYNDQQIKSSILNSDIKEIFFTSEYTFVLFKRAFGIRLAFDRIKRAGTIPNIYFGKDIAYTVLYSPSHMADRGIVNSSKYKEWSTDRKENNLTYSLDDFRSEYYRSAMGFFNN